MGIVDLFSRRKRQRLNAGKPDIYRYDTIPEAVRRQIVDIWLWSTGPVVSPSLFGGVQQNEWSWNFWLAIANAIRHEKGLRELGPGEDPFTQCANYFGVSTAKIEDAVDVLEITFGAIENLSGFEDWQRKELRISIDPSSAINELNFRLQEAGVGYRFENGRIVELNSRYLHAEAVKPALALLSDARFAGPHEEFLHAHELYRTARANDAKTLEDAIASALKAFESTIKVICNLKRWVPPQNATAAPLIAFVIAQGLIPAYMKSSMEGLATLSNRTSRHGQGIQTRALPKYLAAYALHAAASNIVMLIEAFKAVT